MTRHPPTPRQDITFTPYRHRASGRDEWPAGRVPYVHATTYQ